MFLYPLYIFSFVSQSVIGTNDGKVDDDNENKAPEPEQKTANDPVPPVPPTLHPQMSLDDNTIDRSQILRARAHHLNNLGPTEHGSIGNTDTPSSQSQTQSSSQNASQTQTSSRRSSSRRSSTLSDAPPVPANPTSASSSAQSTNPSSSHHASSSASSSLQRTMSQDSIE